MPRVWFGTRRATSTAPPSSAATSAETAPPKPIPGCGVVFKVDPTGKETVLHTFTGGADGYSPYGDLLLDAAGNLYGTAVNGGDVSGSCSDVVELRVPRLRNGV